ncbi:hypothetical protein SAY86_014541 [Trapa natans]|uniref:Uncharacterized protein n=1 Tax=Trapa natans TaxID=22666 RepID=A0AAN7KTJ3_TRANT|nr:hypothetical protein SAY86_014541 [Trapa natans]
MGSDSAVRAFGAIIQRFSINAVYATRPTFLFHQRTVSLSRLFSSSLIISSNPWRSSLYEEENGSIQVRKIYTSFPLCMGRQSYKIAGRKGAQDAKKAKLY